MAVAVAAPAPSPPTPAWIIDRRSDALWLLGSVMVSYAFIVAHVWLGLSVLALWWVWIVVLDGPHVFATLSRTYLDPAEWTARGRLLRWSLLFYVLGPAAFAVSVALGTPVPFGVFFAFANIWAYWHVVRQHYGFMVLYKRKNGDSAPLDDRLDSAVLYVSLIGPFVAFILTHPQARRVLGLSGEPTWENVMAGAAWVAVAVVVALGAARQIERRGRGEPLNTPKLLFWAAALPLSWFAFSPWVTRRADFLAFAVFVTAFHNVQYQAIVWFYHRNRHHAAGSNTRSGGMARALTRRFWTYAAAGVVFTLAYRLAGCALGATPGCGGLASARVVAAGLTPTHLAYGFFWGFALHHYYLDQKIWRLRKDRTLSRDLRLPS